MHIYTCIYLYVCIFMCIQVYVYKQVYILCIYRHTHTQIYMCKVYIFGQKWEQIQMNPGSSSAVFKQASWLKSHWYNGKVYPCCGSGTECTDVVTAI